MRDSDEVLEFAGVAVEIGTVSDSVNNEHVAQPFLPFRRTDMKIVTEDISMAEVLDRKASTAVRGGVAVIQPLEQPVWRCDFPQIPSIASGFPFPGLNPVDHPVPVVVDPSNPLLQ